MAEGSPKRPHDPFPPDPPDKRKNTPARAAACLKGGLASAEQYDQRSSSGQKRGMSKAEEPAGQPYGACRG